MIRHTDKNLLAHRFVFGMSRQDVGLLADCATMVQFHEGEVIFSEGGAANRVYLIESGEVALEAQAAGNAIVTEKVHGGEMLGLSWLFPPHKWRVTARACAPTAAIALNGTLLRKYAEKDDTLGYQLQKRFTEVMTRRFQSMRARLLESISKDEGAPPCE